MRGPPPRTAQPSRVRALIPRYRAASGRENFWSGSAELLLPDEEPLVLEELILHLCSEDPDLFTSPFPPLAELLATWQVARAGDYVAPVGFDFAAWRTLRRVLWLGEKYGIAEDEANAVDVLRHVHLEVAAIVDAVRSPAEAGRGPARTARPARG